MVYRIHWHNGGEFWTDDETYPSESEAARAGEESVQAFRNDPAMHGDLHFTIEEEEEESDYEN